MPINFYRTSGKVTVGSSGAMTIVNQASLCHSERKPIDITTSIVALDAGGADCRLVAHLSFGGRDPPALRLFAG